MPLHDLELVAAWRGRAGLPRVAEEKRRALGARPKELRHASDEPPTALVRRADVRWWGRGRSSDTADGGWQACHS
jgi:hypothetical protein